MPGHKFSTRPVEDEFTACELIFELCASECDAPRHGTLAGLGGWRVGVLNARADPMFGAKLEANLLESAAAHHGAMAGVDVSGLHIEQVQGALAGSGEIGAEDGVGSLGASERGDEGIPGEQGAGVGIP